MDNIFRMPAEWEPQAATWVSWPHNEETWPDNLAEAQAEFVAFVQAVAEVQPVCVLAGESNSAARQQAEKALAGTPNVTLIEIETNDAWARDYAPTFVIHSREDSPNDSLVAINWFYNAWGGKYPPFDADQLVASKVASLLGIECVSPPLCFEGGAIEINEWGLLLCTRSCAFDPNRNPDTSQSKVETIFAECLGARHTVWLSGDAIEGDDTDGHIDQLARFTDENTIVYAWCDDETDPQFAGLKKNLEDLQSGLAEVGQGEFRLIPLPIPAAIELSGRRVPASYCNFLICNQRVIVPQFGDARTDEIAMQTLTELFPTRIVSGLNSVNLSVGLGSFHCLSQQMPETK